jgi:hypothetical protein
MMLCLCYVVWMMMIDDDDDYDRYDDVVSCE